MLAYREKRRGRGVRGCCRWYLIWAGTKVSLLAPLGNVSTAISGRHTDSGVFLIPLVASLVGGCGREVCALLLLLSQTAAHSGKRSL